MYVWNTIDTIEAIYEGARGAGGTRSNLRGRHGAGGTRSNVHIRKHIYEGARGRSNIGSSSTRGQRSNTIPEILHSGLLVGKHPTSITGIKIPLPICTGWGRYLPAILNSGFQDGAEALLRERQRGMRHIGGEEHFKESRLQGPLKVSCGPHVAKSTSTRAPEGQEAHRWREALLRE